MESEKKRILIVSMSAELGGIEKSMISFLDYLVSLPNMSVDLMLWKQRGELLADIPSAVHIISSPAPGGLLSILRSCSVSRLLRYIRLKLHTRKGTPWLVFPMLNRIYDVAIAYSQDGYSPYYIIDRVSAMKRYMWYHHGAYLHTGRAHELDMEYYPRFNKVVAVSESIKNIIEKEVPTCKQNLVVIPNLIDEDAIIRKSQEPCLELEGVTILKLVTVGRLSQEKGQLRALDVANKLKIMRMDFQWVFVGDGPDMAACKAKVENLNLCDVCQFIGSRTNPYPYIANADIYVSPSYVEADPVTIQEALILNKVIVSSNIKALAESLESGKYGRLCSNDDINTYVDSIIEMAQNDKMGEEYLLNISKRQSRNSISQNKIERLLEL